MSEAAASPWSTGQVPLLLFVRGKVTSTTLPLPPCVQRSPYLSTFPVHQVLVSECSHWADLFCIMVYSDAALRPQTPRITDVPQSHREQEILLPNIFTPIIYFWCHCCKIQRLHHYYSLHSYHSCIESQWWEARCLRGCSWWEVDIVGHGVCWAELGARVSAVRRPGPGPNTAPCHGRTIHHNPGCRTAALSLLYSPALYRLQLYSDHNLSSFLYLYIHTIFSVSD